MTASLKVVKPESMDPELLLEWSKNAAASAAERCREAKEYFDAMQNHHTSIVQLLESMKKLVGAPVNSEEVEELVDTFMEVTEAMEALAAARSTDDGSATLDEAEDEVLITDAGRDAAKELEAEARAFLKVYSRHKARLGLQTQEDVANLTGIDRRHISAIERGLHKPQFRTLKRIADAFRIDVAELIGG